MIPKEFERSNLALELKAGKKRLELALHGLTNEQCGRAGAGQSESISELVSHLIKNEFLALNEECERLSASETQAWKNNIGTNPIPARLALLPDG